MKSFRTITILFLTLISLAYTPKTNSQQTKEIEAGCIQQIRNGFIPNSQPMKALLTGSEVAEFRTTLFEGNTYRIATCSPTNKKIWFSVYDTNKNLLFSSSQQQYSASWDFQMEGNMECIIEAGLMPDGEDSGLALVLIGFKTSGVKL
ncbi:hypothetical protein [Marinilabilia rubra]|uniref:Uncharacterized protein n=1 Tax=Marinilabilia rubra TaxID=2162893 RepID=A0A2U2B6I2_9BACT|nr:hypothetical protein [Marinilabilia rubra]PWD98681.1 hypothetical protein DDZ16_14575 [Marinilabilia rubra]